MGGTFGIPTLMGCKQRVFSTLAGTNTDKSGTLGGGWWFRPYKRTNPFSGHEWTCSVSQRGANNRSSIRLTLDWILGGIRHRVGLVFGGRPAQDTRNRVLNEKRPHQ